MCPDLMDSASFAMKDEKRHLFQLYEFAFEYVVFSLLPKRVEHIWVEFDKVKTASLERSPEQLLKMV